MRTRPYVIRQGDYLTKLAARFAFDADRIWSDEANAELRAKRPNREILHPGDVLRIPARGADGGRIAVGGTHTFRGTVPTTEVRLVLKRADGQLASGEAYRIEGLPTDAEDAAGTTGDDGVVHFRAPVDLDSVRLVIESTASPRTSRTLVIRIGHMDPVDEPSGVRKRLQHLGFGSRLALWDEPLRRAAIESFQRWRELPVTGEADDATKQALVEANGS